MDKSESPTPHPAATQPMEGSVRSDTGSRSRSAASYDRRRAGRACHVCRARKTKCDNQRPVCGFCLATGGNCRYPDDEANDHSKLDRGTLAILQRLGDVEQHLAALLLEHHHPPLASQPQAARSPDVMRMGPSPGSANTAREPEILASPKDAEGSGPPTTRIILESAEMTVESISGWPVFGLGQIPSLVAHLSQGSSPGPSHPSMESIFDLDNETVVRLVENFLSNNHIKNPIFDVHLLWGQVRAFLDSGIGWDGTTCLVLLICAVSVLAPSIAKERLPGFSRRPDRLARAEAFFQASQRRIGMVYHENSLLAMQCGFLTAVYLMSTFRVLAAWKAFTQAGTQCFGWFTARAGLGSRNSHVEESVYWSCLKSELELRSELGLPGSSLSEMHYPNVYPSPPGSTGMASYSVANSSLSRGTSEAARVELERGWFFYLAEIALRRILNDALTSRYRADSWYFTTDWWAKGAEGDFHQYIIDFKHKLDTWYEMLPESMSFPQDPEEALGDPLKGILRGHLVDILDILCFPAVKAVVLMSPSELDPIVAQIAREALHTAAGRIKSCREGFWHRHQGTWLMIRTCSRSALLLLGVAIRARKDAEEGREESGAMTDILPEMWRESISDVIRLIEYWVEESPDLAVLLGRFRHLYAMV